MPRAAGSFTRKQVADHEKEKRRPGEPTQNVATSRTAPIHHRLRTTYYQKGYLI